MSKFEETYDSERDHRDWVSLRSLRYLTCDTCVRLKETYHMIRLSISLFCVILFMSIVLFSSCSCLLKCIGRFFGYDQSYHMIRLHRQRKLNPPKKTAATGCSLLNLKCAAYICQKEIFHTLHRQRKLYTSKETTATDVVYLRYTMYACRRKKECQEKTSARPSF